MGFEQNYSQAESENAQIILYGHTHVALMERVSGYMVLNPGSISESRSNMSESYAILDVTNDYADAQIYYV